jgi:hypothetical protein
MEQPGARAEAGLHEDLQQPALARVLADLARARHHDALVTVDFPRHRTRRHRVAQYERGQHQLLFGSVARADEDAIQRLPSRFVHIKHVVRREGLRHLRHELRQVEGVRGDVFRTLVGAEEQRSVLVGLPFREKLRGLLVGREDAVQSAELRRHVRHREAEVRGEMLQRVADVLHRALHRHGVAAQLAQVFKMTSLPVSPNGNRPR